jgi:Ca2+/Na+ antiporter
MRRCDGIGRLEVYDISMSDSPNEIKVRRALKTVLILHVCVSIAFVVFSIYLFQGAHRADERQQRMADGEKAILAKIQSETDLEKLRTYALKGLNGSFEYIHTIDAEAKNLVEAFAGLSALPIATSLMAFWGLRACRTKE